MSAERPVLWSFRRCPYAIRARLAIRVAGVPVHLREILLREKPRAFRDASPSATVPCLKTADAVLDESREIMLWALQQRDPEHWLARQAEDEALIDVCDGPFKAALDHTKYHTRHPDRSREDDREAAAVVLRDWEARLARQGHLTGPDFSLADAAILPFVRQFAMIDRAWFDAQDWPHLIDWLDRFLASEALARVMGKYPPWQPGADEVPFP